ncbi:uncharacterized protein LOC129941754 isoform X2 [Eupeodes corollae]|uniref:uncharacterized protein LOC129941754 isoform X2 n=1 Tax=Eupeodes corollae TaxID=290404 RepID=UPI002490FAA5|nr:uncharacterized protein LOC129941754 isoform X2 [Eupeodes corollae]
MIVLGIINSRICHWLFYTCIAILIPFSTCSISVNRIITRTPKDNDIGLIFDINFINTANEEKELLECHIRSENECCINLTESIVTTNAGKIVGGFFGYIEPGEMKTVSVIWPTTELFNRVGYCDIIISSTNNVKNEEKHFTEKLKFDTRFAQIDPSGTTFRKRPDYQECLNWDMDFLNNCTRINCEEKYFGKRNFYNITTKMCEPAAKCEGKNEIYDIYSNECLNSDELMDPEEIENIKRGYYENNTLDFSKPNHENANTNDENICPSVEMYRKVKEQTIWTEIINGLSIVIATITIYSSVCFCVFLLVNWMSKMSVNNNIPPHKNL